MGDLMRAADVYVVGILLWSMGFERLYYGENVLNRDCSRKISIRCHPPATLLLWFV